MEKEKRKALYRLFEGFLAILPYLCLVFVVVFFIIKTDGRILLPVMLKNLFGQMVVLIIIAVGSIFVFAQGELDISVGAVLGIGSLAATLTINYWTHNFIVVLLVCIAVCMVVKGIIGILISKFHLPVFMATLVIKVLLTAALAYMCMNFNTAGGDSSGIAIPSNSQILRFDTVATRLICIAIVAIAAVYLLHFKRMGKYCKALGGNATCSAQSGVNRGRYMIFAFLFSGFATGLAALVYTLRVHQVASTTGSGMEMSLIIAVVIGGMPLKGGSKTKALAPLIGSIIYVILDYGLVMIGTPSGVIQAIRGVVFLVMIGLLNANQKLTVLPR